MMMMMIIIIIAIVERHMRSYRDAVKK